MSEKLEQLRGFYTIGETEEWEGHSKYEIADWIGDALGIADQQATRIAALEAEVARLRTFASELANAHAVECDDIRQRARKALAAE